MKLPIQSQPVIRYDSSSINGNIALGINISAWCTCTEDGSVDINKCGNDLKPRCSGSDCDCVQK